jgi:hypothetical protein
MGAVRHADQSLQVARLGVVDVAPAAHGGGGVRRESIAFVGADMPHMTLAAANESVMLRPALADARNRPTVRQQPFTAENAIFLDRIERVWEATAPLDPKWRIDATAQLGGNGLALDVDNAVGQTLESPLVIWNGRALAIADLPLGRTTVRDMQLNPRGRFNGIAALTSEQGKRRAQVVAASLAPPRETAANSTAFDTPPMLIGWIADAGDPLAAPAERDMEIDAKTMTMIRTPLRFNVAAAGIAVAIPAGLVRVDTGRMPYDHDSGESVPTPQGGSWRIRFGPLRQAGRLKPSRVTVAARVTLPAHTLRLTMPSRAANDAPLEWSRKVGTIETTIECGERDYDADGRITMTLDVEQLDPASTVTWQISDLVAKIDGVITGPPAPIVLDVISRPADQSDTEPAQEK